MDAATGLRDYVVMQRLMLQQDEPEDFVIATGGQHSVREFVQRAAAELGITVEFSGQGGAEIGTVAAVEKTRGGLRARCKPGDIIVRVDPRCFRPTEVETLLGDPSKAKAKLGWAPTIGFSELVREMVESDHVAAKRDSVVKLAGFQAYDYHQQRSGHAGKYSTMHPIVESKRQELAAVCRPFGVRRLEVFGSAARDDFDEARSDIDLLVEFDDDPNRRALGGYFGLKEALERLFGRPVDLVSLNAVSNPYVRASIERSRQLVYAA